jgi:hypothetical protein
VEFNKVVEQPVVGRIKRVDDESGELTDLSFVKEGDELDDESLFYLHCFDVIKTDDIENLKCKNCGLDRCLEIGFGDDSKLGDELRKKVKNAAKAEL